MRRPSTTRLPRSLLDELQDTSGDRRSSGSVQSLRNTRPHSRKDRRKQDRQIKKQKQSNHNNAPHRRQPDHSETSDISEDDYSEPAKAVRRQPSPEPVKEEKQAPARKSKKRKAVEKDDDDEPLQESPAIAERPRKAVADKLDEDDAEIAALEKKLKVKGKKLPKAFQEDGLDWLLEGLDSEDEEKERDRQYLADKRGKKRDRAGQVIEHHGSRESDSASSQSDQDDDSEDSDLDMLDDDDDSMGSESEEENVPMGDKGDWSGFSSEEEEAPTEPPLRPKPAASRPDPTKPAIPEGQPAKYVPPAQRRLLNGDGSVDAVLRKKIQGQVNRLTEPTMLQIVKSIEEFYRDHPRQSVTSTLTTLVLASVSNEVNTRETFFTLYGGFIAALYKILGTDFGAYFAQSVVEEFDKCYSEALADGNVEGPSSSKKQANDLASLLAELYNFGVIGSTLMFDFIRIFVTDVAELNAELLLKIVKSSGPQLRQDDPSALKDIVSMLNASVAKVGTEKLSTRFKFMMETLTNLKNNKARKANDTSVVASEAIVRMKKTLGTLNTRSLRASEPLRPSLQDIRNVETKGKWWLVGASWRHNLATDEPKDGQAPDEAESIEFGLDGEDVTNFLQLAREQRMNTDIRRAIFVAIMSSEDYRDARERLLKLRLKRNQEREIPHVLLHCCGNEPQYNPYYALISQQLCMQHSLRMTFQFSLWELFRKMGEEDEMGGGDSMMDEDEEDQMPLRKIVNLAKLYGYLIAQGSLSLTILKTLQLASPQPATRNFLEIMFITIFSEIREKYPKSSKKREAKVKELFLSTAEHVSLARGLEHFLKRNVGESDIVSNKKERESVKHGCQVAQLVLQNIILEGADSFFAD